MPKLEFPPLPNATTAMREPCIRSACGRFELVEDPGVGWYAIRRGRPPEFVGLYRRRESAEAQCQQVADRQPKRPPPKKRAMSAAEVLATALECA